MVRSISAFVCGLVFAVGLGLAGMTQPAKVLGFLDVTGRWDSTLAFVMAAAVTVGLVLFPKILSRSQALSGDPIALPTAHAIDGPLLLGAGLFGIGWGLSGYCPGPAIVSLVTGRPPVLIFVAAMAIGLFLGGRLRFPTNSPAFPGGRSGKASPAPPSRKRATTEAATPAMHRRPRDEESLGRRRQVSS